VEKTKRSLAAVSAKNQSDRFTSPNANRSNQSIREQRDHLAQVNERLAMATASTAELVVELGEKNEELSRQKEESDLLAERLARASATAAELVAELESKNDEICWTNAHLARANAHASELMAEIEMQNERIASLNDALSRANAHAAEVVAELDENRKELQDALDHVKTLQGIIPICMYCYDIRDDQDSWHEIEQYVTEHSDADFSHSLCPSCSAQYFPDDEHCADKFATKDGSMPKAGEIRRGRLRPKR
jgi:chromosome segregation ATPase